MHIADAIGLGFLAAIAGLASASIVVSILRLLHRNDLARRITEKLNNYLWLLNLGGGAYRRDHRHS
jgi:hypothetical protein